MAGIAVDVFLQIFPLERSEEAPLAIEWHRIQTDVLLQVVVIHPVPCLDEGLVTAVEALQALIRPSTLTGRYY
ncbi:MAG: hypothetical protein ABW185_26940 [Sedimenticola sp.]